MLTNTRPTLIPRPMTALDEGTIEALDVRARTAEQASVRWHLRVLRRRRRLAASILLIVVGGAALYSAVVTPVYEARAKLLIEPENPNVVNFKQVVEQNTSNPDYYETELGLLRSRSLARSTLDALGLWDIPELAKPSYVMLPARVAGWLPALGQSAPQANETRAQSRVVDAFLSRVSLGYRADNRLVDVRVRSVDPGRAADMANTLARVFIEQKVGLKLQASKAASEWLQARLSEQASNVQASEAALQDYREQHPDLSLIDQQNVAAGKLADLSAAATRARTERIEADTLYAQLRSIQENPAASDTLPLILMNPYIQQLKGELAALQREEVTKSQRLGERHPDMMRLHSAIERTEAQLAAEIAKIAESARNQKLALESKERSLLAAVDAQKRQTLGISRIGIEYTVLEREARSNRQVFEALLQRAKEAELSSALTTTNVRVVDPAELPRSPVFPRRKLILLLSLLVAVPLALGSAMAREALDDRIKSPEEITSSLGIRFLGFAPLVSRKVAATGVAFANERSAPEFAEALRGVRANLLLSAPAHDAKSLLVTSTGPGEGKTLVASNLAVALARCGRRVLLVDADMRRAKLHKVFGLPLEPGLATVLQRQASAACAVQLTSVVNLSVLAAGVSQGVPGDFLQPDVFADAIASVRDQFDWIVLDSPPVMAASEVMTLAQAATAVIFVIGAHMTSAREAKAALEQLAPSGAAIVGAVLSRSEEDRQSPYSYSHYHKYYRTY